MSINLKIPDIRELKPRITVFGVGGAGGNAVNNMINAGLQGVDFVVGNTDAQALTMSRAERIIQMGVQATEGLGAGSQPDVGSAAAQEVIDEIRDHLTGAHMVFVTAGMGGGTGTGAAPVVARAARELGILTVGVVTKPFHFEGQRRTRVAEGGIVELQKSVDTLIIIPNQNLFRVANEKTTFADAFAMADQVLYSGVACITDLMVKEGLINLDFADVRAVMREMGKAMMGTGEASGEKRALRSAEAAICNPLIDDVSMRGARGLLISITGGKDLTLYEVDEAATRIREEVDADANIIVGATFDESLDGIIRVSVVATGVDIATGAAARPAAAIPAPPQARPAAPAAPAAAARRRGGEVGRGPRAPHRRVGPAAQGGQRPDRRGSGDARCCAAAGATAHRSSAAPAAGRPHGRRGGRGGAHPVAGRPQAEPVRRPDAAGSAGAGRERPAQGLHPAAARAAGKPRAADDADLRGHAGPRSERVPGTARRDAGAGASGEAAAHPAATPRRGRSRPARRRAGGRAEGDACARAGATGRASADAAAPGRAAVRRPGVGVRQARCTAGARRPRPPGAAAARKRGRPARYPRFPPAAGDLRTAGLGFPGPVFSL